MFGNKWSLEALSKQKVQWLHVLERWKIAHYRMTRSQIPLLADNKPKAKMAAQVSH